MAHNRKPQRQSRNSVDSRVKAARMEHEVLPPPKGVVFTSDQELTLWRQYTAVRVHSDWRDADLLQVAKLVGLEVRCRSEQALLNEEGHVVNQRENPRFKIITTMQNQQLSIIRCLHLNPMANAAATLNKHGTGRITGHQKPEMSLLAGPEGWGMP
jgi:hypothetical protein